MMKRMLMLLMVLAGLTAVAIPVVMAMDLKTPASSDNTPSASPSTAPSASPEVPTYHSLTPEEAKARMDSGDTLVILDVRTQEEYDAGHIPGAIVLPNETIADEQPSLLPDLNAEILVYCRSGRRSREAADKLVAMGYTSVYDFGGIINWPYDTVKE